MVSDEGSEHDAEVQLLQICVVWATECFVFTLQKCLLQEEIQGRMILMSINSQLTQVRTKQQTLQPFCSKQVGP